MKYKISLLLFLTITLAFGQFNFTKQFNTLNAGQRLELSIPFSDHLGNTADLPVILLKGTEKGPVFTLAGVHGFEVSPIIAVQKEIDLTQLKGTLIVLPISNPGSFYNRTPYKNPQDNTNLNGAFPGKIKGSITLKIAHFITTNIIPLSDVFLDIHSGDAPEDLIPLYAITITNPKRKYCGSQKIIRSKWISIHRFVSLLHIRH